MKIQTTAVPPKRVSPKDVLELLGLDMPSPMLEGDMDIINLLERGLPKKCIDALIDRAGFTPSEISRAMHINERTLRRWRARAGNIRLLTPLQSSQIWALGSLIKQAHYALGSNRVALLWLRGCQIGSSGRRPMDILSTSIGLGAISDLLTQIDNCVYG